LPDRPVEASAPQLTRAWLDVAELDCNDLFTGDLSRVTYGVDTTTEVVSTDPNNSTVSLLVGVNLEHRDGGEVPFHRLSVRVGGTFVWADTAPSEERIEGWLKFNGMYLLWPYARTYLATLTALSGRPALHIMTIAVPRPNLGHPTTEFDEVDLSDEALGPGGSH
jgi:hypothetical protein